ncbi:MAG TPA: hypothetical protein VHX59_20470 [Mycobacteriales bacterium]|nr:hypothetical protein [Mycobacteriales bacterium]
MLHGNRSLRLGGAIAIAALLAGTAGCQSGKQDKASTPKTNTSTLPSAVTPAPSSGPSASGSASPSGDSAPSSGASGSSSSADSSVEPSVTPKPSTVAGLDDPCSLLSKDAIDAALGVESGVGTSNSGAAFVGCSYGLKGSAGTGSLVLHVAADRAEQIYDAVETGGGFSDVAGVGTKAAYNSEDGRFIVRTDKDFVELTLPSDLKGATSASPAGARKAGTTLTEMVLSELG